ncbi:hypothetical protein Pcinc_017584 [Petrolisthes cinctipes]|uniref:Elongator complex protein 6 n=1 Tax=Petrolisthes cinctipes TaxID=88211 RepID=A0AAE1FTW6_PETCI|nr:hypothetical protein Pcinc_017584 [Petrolisthes cinctipes]
MFESVASAVRGSGIDGVGGKLTLVTQTSTTSASGLIINFIASSVTADWPVCLLTLHNTWGHYCNIGNKVGLNLRNQREQGTVKVVDGLQLVSGVIDAEGNCDDNHSFSFICKPLQYPLKNLYDNLKQTVHPWRESGVQFQIILEDVASLLHLGVKRKDIETFIHYCWNLVGRSPPSIVGSLVVVATVDETDEDANLLSHNMIHLASLHLSLHGLSTGPSREVHGLLRITALDRNCPNQCVPLIQNFQYKMEEKNMKLFAPGTSANIL